MKGERHRFFSNGNHKGGMKQERALNMAISSVNYCTKKKGLFVFFNKVGVPYASTAYLFQHLLTAKVSSPFLLNTAVVLLTRTTQYSSAQDFCS